MPSKVGFFVRSNHSKADFKVITLTLKIFRKDEKESGNYILKK